MAYPPRQVTIHVRHAAATIIAQLASSRGKSFASVAAGLLDEAMGISAPDLALDAIPLHQEYVTENMGQPARRRA